MLVDKIIVETKRGDPNQTTVKDKDGNKVEGLVRIEVDVSVDKTEIKLELCPFRYDVQVEGHAEMFIDFEGTKYKLVPVE